MNMREVAGSEKPTNTWAFEFRKHSLMFNHQDDLLARIVSDIGEYSFKQGQDLCELQRFEDACQHFKWSRTMFTRYETMENTKKTAKIAEIDRCIGDAKQRYCEQQQKEGDDFVG